MKILITGGAGYIGSILCGRLLEAGHSVTVLDNLLFGEQNLFHLCADPKFNFILGDARNESIIKGLISEADILIPLAAIVGAPACNRDPFSARSVNLEAIRSVNQCRTKNQLMIYPTTNSGYGVKGSETYCTEDSPLEPISLYGETKVKAEQELLNTPNTISLRLATVFGMSPRMRLDLLVNHFVYAAATSGSLTIFEKDFKRNFIHVRDVADCFSHCIDHADQMVGRPYNVGLDSANLSKKELALEIKKQVPNFHLDFAEIGSDPDKRNYIVSNERLRNAGFEATRSVENGIQELLKGYRMIGRTKFSNV